MILWAENWINDCTTFRIDTNRLTTVDHYYSRIRVLLVILLVILLGI